MENISFLFTGLEGQFVDPLKYIIDGLQSVPTDSVNKGMAAKLVEQTKEVLEKSFVYVHQHGGDDVTQKPRIGSNFSSHNNNANKK